MFAITTTATAITVAVVVAQNGSDEYLIRFLLDEFHFIILVVTLCKRYSIG